MLLPLNYRLAAPEWESILDHSSAVGIITESQFAGQIESLDNVRITVMRGYPSKPKFLS